MKRFVSLFLAAALLCAGFMTSCQSGAEEDADPTSSAAETFTPHRFGKGDLSVNKLIMLGMTVEEVKEYLGAPDSQVLVTNDNFIYGAYLSMSYGGLDLTFYDLDEGTDYRLNTISSESPDVKFPGGLHAGSTKDEVLYAFTRDDNPPPLEFANYSGGTDRYGEYIYGDYNANDYLTVKPKGVREYAYINDYSVTQGYDKEYLMEYYYGDPLDWNEDETAYEGDTYSMVFYMDSETDVVKSIRLSCDREM